MISMHRTVADGRTQLVSRQMNRVASSPIKLTAGCLAGRLVEWMDGSFSKWLAGSLAGWLADRPAH